MTFDFSVLTDTVITMFLLLIIGYAARKLNYTDDKFSKGLSNFIICVAQPFMIISAVLGIEYSPENLKTGFFVMLLGLLIHALTAVAAFAATFKFRNNDERRITEFSILFANCGFLGFPILKSMFGDIGVFWGSFFVIMYNIVTWTYGMYILGRARSQIKMSFVKMILNYGTTPCIIGIVLFLLRVKLPSPVMSAMNYMGSLCTPLSMIIIGGLLATIPFGRLFTNLKVYYVCVIRLFVITAVITLTAKVCGLSSEFVLFSTVMSAVPTAANSAMFAERYDLMPEYGAHMVGMTTLLSAFTIPVMVTLSNFIINI